MLAHAEAGCKEAGWLSTSRADPSRCQGTVHLVGYHVCHDHLTCMAAYALDGVEQRGVDAPDLAVDLRGRDHRHRARTEFGSIRAQNTCTCTRRAVTGTKASKASAVHSTARHSSVLQQRGRCCLMQVHAHPATGSLVSSHRIASHDAVCRAAPSWPRWRSTAGRRP